MKKFRTLLCILLAVAMVLSFAACGKKADDQAPADDAADNQPADDNKPADDANQPADDGEDAPPADDGGDETPAVDSPDVGFENSVAIMYKDIDEVLNKPHELQPGTSATFHVNDVPAQTPWNCTAEVWMLFNLYEGLNYSYMGDASQLRPMVATEWTHSDDYLTWTFQIREGVTFTDGTVCDAHAIVESWNIHNEVAPADFTNINVASWEATGDYEVTVHMSNTCPYIESALGRLWLVSPTALKEYGPNDNRAAIGTSGYYIESYTAGVELVFKARSDYYLYERQPVVETITFKFILDDNTKLMAMLNGDLDGYTFSSVESFYNLQDFGFDGTLMQGHGNASPLFVNAKTVPEFQIFEVRKAFQRLIDMEALNEMLYDGMGLVQEGLWAVGSSGDVPWPEGFYYDQEEGLELLAQAGVDPNEWSFSTKVQDSAQNYFVAIQGQLSKVGINMEIEPIEAEANFTYMMKGEYAVTAGNSGYTSALPFLPWTFILLPTHLLKEVWCDIYDPELYDAMCNEFYAMTSGETWEDMLEHCHNLTRMLQEDYGAIPGIQSPYFAAFNKDLKGIVLTTENHIIQWCYLYY